VLLSVNIGFNKQQTKETSSPYMVIIVVMETPKHNWGQQLHLQLYNTFTESHRDLMTPKQVYNLSAASKKMSRILIYTENQVGRQKTEKEIIKYKNVNSNILQNVKHKNRNYIN